MELLRLENIRVQRGGRLVLDGLFLSLSMGEKVVVAGDNGAGKTTLVEAVMGFVPLEGGEIYFKGRKVETEQDFSALRRLVGYSFQNPDEQLFSATVDEELAFGPMNLGLSRREVEERLRKVMETFSIEHLRGRLVHELSGGEKRILSIACVATMEPELFILDEPSLGLDRKRFGQLVSFLQSTNTAVLVVTHDTALLKSLGWKTLWLEDGVLHTTFEFPS
jgi:cobalt/nickel transport system ATP-binding protein